MSGPIVKWVGGKGKLLGQLLPMLPAGADEMRHIEPFVGGGAMFFAREPRFATLCDINRSLIETYRAVRDDVGGVVSALRVFKEQHSEETYYRVRDDFNARKDIASDIRAAMFIYLNKTCFNGLYRVNRKGEFNVPAGRYKNPGILDEVEMRDAARAFERADLRCQPFEKVLDNANPGDFVYFDPPYEPVSETANFTSYDQGGFTREDQTRLRDVFRELDRRGCKLMLSNSDVPFIRELYAGWQIDTVQAPRAINSKGTGRGKVSEVVVRNYRTSAEIQTATG